MLPTPYSNDDPSQSFQNNPMIEWVEDMPRPVKTKSMKREQIQEMYHALGALPYRGEWNAESQQYDLDPRFDGATNIQVMIARDYDDAVLKEGGKARERIMDRLLGKPKQAVESVSMTMNYEDWLDQSYKQSLEEDNTTIDITPTLDDLPEYDESQYDSDEYLEELTRGI